VSRRYARMTLAEKQRYARPPQRSRVRCNKCRVLVEARDWGRHIQGCTPELETVLFTPEGGQ
jgi:hypothetical protein